MGLAAGFEQELRSALLTPPHPPPKMTKHEKAKKRTAHDGGLDEVAVVFHLGRHETCFKVADWHGRLYAEHVGTSHGVPISKRKGAAQVTFAFSPWSRHGRLKLI